MRLYLALQILIANITINHAFHATTTPTTFNKRNTISSSSSALYVKPFQTHFQYPSDRNDPSKMSQPQESPQESPQQPPQSSDPNVILNQLADTDTNTDTETEVNEPKYAPRLDYRERLQSKQESKLPSNTVVSSPSALEETSPSPAVSNVQETTNVVEELQPPPVEQRIPKEEVEEVVTPPPPTQPEASTPPKEHQGTPPPPLQPQEYQVQEVEQVQYQQQPQPPQSSDPNVLLNRLADQGRGQQQPQQQQPPQQQQQQQYQQEPQRPKDPNVLVGRNKDADQIANSSDMYFAQLKLDSKIRKRAFLSGDYNTSNQVFEDDRVKNLPGELEKNPFIRAVLGQSNRSNDNELSTSDEESLPTTMMFTNAEVNKPKKAQGLNYRQKLEARKQRSSNVNTSTETSAVVAPPTTPPAAPIEIPVVEHPESITSSVSAPPIPVNDDNYVDEPPAAPVEIPVVEHPESITSSVSAPPIPVNDDNYVDESRVKIRLLTGLLLKHKGGPGFGAGRLKAPEAERFIETAGDVITMLKSELPSSEVNTKAGEQQVSTATTTDDSVLSSAFQSLQEAMQMCQDPSLSDEEKSKILLSAQLALQQATSALDDGTVV